MRVLAYIVVNISGRKNLLGVTVFADCAEGVGCGEGVSPSSKIFITRVFLRLKIRKTRMD